jgi:hypothetical protein
MEGLIGNFFVSSSLDIMTLKVSPSHFKVLTRRSIYLALKWLQLHVLLYPNNLLIKKRLVRGMKLDYNANCMLIKMCINIVNNNQIQEKQIYLLPTTSTSCTLDQIVSPYLYITDVGGPNGDIETSRNITKDSKLFLFVPIKHGNHTDLVSINNIVI